MKERYDLPCNIAQTLNVIGDRWTMLILHEVLVGRQTFSTIKKSLAGISSNMLSDRLKYLEERGLLTSTLYSEHPPRYRYSLTKSGQALETVFHAMIIWGQQHLETCHKRLVHPSCNHEVELRHYCPHCEQLVEQPAVVEVEM